MRITRNLLLMWMIVFSLSGLSQNKAFLDLKFPNNDEQCSQTSQKEFTRSVNGEFESLENNKTGFTLLSDGYFTIGTTNGLSSNNLDDNCQISFGHPFALTSYAYFCLDSVEYHPELYFYNSPKQLVKQGDTLLGLHATDLKKIELQFNLIQKNDGDIVRLMLRIRNIDTVSHNIGLGLLFDPALGLWGDGYPTINGELIQKDTTLVNTIPQTFHIWERQGSSKGIGVEFEFFNNQPSKLMLGNWFNFHYNKEPLISAIYDLGINMAWNESSIGPDEDVSFTMDVKLLSPEFPDGPFMRSDLPHFLSIENNLLFPRTVKSMVKLTNNGNANIENAKLEISETALWENWSSPDTIDIPAESTVFSSAFMEMSENYKDKIITLELNLVDDMDTLDQIVREVFIPAAPFSDSGLVVTIDTIILSGYPTIDLIFKSQIEETGQYLKNLSGENVFFYEDSVRIENFTLAKDTSGGVNKADIVFVLDVTGSMGNEIDGVKENIVEFADSLSYQGIDFRLGMVTFLDEVENIYDFTSDVQQFQEYVNQQYAHGGGDHAENSLDALMQACQFDFRPTANRVFIWITDATYHINNSYTPLTPQDVVNEMLTHSIEPHGIGKPIYQLEYFNPILFPTAGDFYDIDGNFRDILIEISRLNSTGSYRLSYNSNADPGDTYMDIVEIHYAGLGGMDSITFVAPSKSQETTDLTEVRFFPNPFYSNTNIEIHNPQGAEAKIDIYNVQGNRVLSKRFESGNKKLVFTWDAKDAGGKNISNGIYFIHCELYDQTGKTERLPVMKLIYLNQ